MYLNFTPTVVGAADLPARGSLTVTGSFTTREDMLSHTEVHIYRRRPYAAGALPRSCTRSPYGESGSSVQGTSTFKELLVLNLMIFRREDKKL